MKSRQTIRPLFMMLLTTFTVLAQNSQQLNDQLWEAARSGEAAAVTALLDKGADVNAKFRYGATALFKAAERGNLEVVKVLLARGADVKVKDTFYGATAMTWALDKKHSEVIRALLEKDRESVDDVLMNGARENQVALVRIALEVGGAKPETFTAALTAASAGPDSNAEIVEMLKKAGAVPPPEVDAATLQSYVGTYRSDQGMEVGISLNDRKLFAALAGQSPIVLMAVDKITFKPAAFDGITVLFKVAGDKVSGFELKQGANATLLKRIEEAKQP